MIQKYSIYEDSFDIVKLKAELYLELSNINPKKEVSKISNENKTLNTRKYKNLPKSSVLNVIAEKEASIKAASFTEQQRKQSEILRNVPIIVTSIPWQIVEIFEKKYTDATNIAINLILKRTELLKEASPKSIILTKYMLSKCSLSCMNLFRFIIDNVDKYSLYSWNMHEFGIFSTETQILSIKFTNLQIRRNIVNSNSSQTLAIPSMLIINGTKFSDYTDIERYIIFCAFMYVKQWHHFIEDYKIAKLYVCSEQEKIFNTLEKLYDD